MYHEARDMLRKAQIAKNGNCQTILEKLYKDSQYLADLSENGWTEEQIRQYDALALEDHSYEATSGERRRWEKNWQFVLNKEGKQGPMRQRHDFPEAKQKHRQQYKEHAESTGEGMNPIHATHQARLNYQQQCKGSEEYNFSVHPRTGWTYYHPRTGSTMIGSRILLAIFKPGLNSKTFFRSNS